MRRIRALLLLSFAALGGIALFVSRSDATPGTVRIVVPGVWFREGNIGNWPVMQHGWARLR
jgi:hypothetical protein